MATGMVLLIGGQPAPNVIPAMYSRPSRLLLLHSNETAEIARKVAQFLAPADGGEHIRVDPFELLQIQRALDDAIAKQPNYEWTFNITGGTKQMAIAASLVAQHRGGQLIYLQSDQNQSRLLVYDTKGGQLRLARDEQLPPLLTLQKYLELHIGNYIERTPPQQNEFERAVLTALRSSTELDEVVCNIVPQGISGNIEIDFAVRIGTQFGVGEIKKKASKSQGIDQLKMLSGLLGTYTHSFLVTSQALHSNDAMLAERSRINVVVLPCDETASLAEERTKQLIDAIRRQLSRSP